MKAKTTTIRATSRASVKIGESFYTMEYQEERLMPEDYTENDLLEERADLWSTCNSEVDGQIQDILSAYADNKRSARK